MKCVYVCVCVCVYIFIRSTLLLFLRIIICRCSCLMKCVCVCVQTYMQCIYLHMDCAFVNNSNPHHYHSVVYYSDIKLHNPQHRLTDSSVGSGDLNPGDRLKWEGLLSRELESVSLSSPQLLSGEGEGEGL